jgi:zinc-ribbon domain
MYCPSCGSQNADETKFCRMCGANLALVPQALTGQLPGDRDSRRHRRRRRDENRPPNIGHGLTRAFMGVGFLIVALAIFVSPGGRGWWWAMLFPAFSLIGQGVAEIVSANVALKQMRGNQPTTAAVPERRVTGELSPEPPGFHIPPPSVTENTTRHLDPNKDHYPQSR